jgi:hypothetical protein
VLGNNKLPKLIPRAAWNNVLVGVGLQVHREANPADRRRAEDNPVLRVVRESSEKLNLSTVSTLTSEKPPAT